MCLVAFQKNFRKIFSGVWKRRRKTQPRKKSSTIAISRRHDCDQRRDLATARSRSTSRSRDGAIAINIAISRRRDLAFARSRDGAISHLRDRAVDRDLDPAPFFDLARLFFLSLSCCVFCFFSPSLCVLRDSEVI